MIELEYNLMLAELAGKSGETLDIGASLPLPELEARLGFPPDSVGMLLINGAWAPLDSVIKDGDFVQLYPHMEGG
ncbi:MAG: MoaD/ThiS family protein [Acidobacteria bacterium]|jgi:molybdopterin converting factor small subunit|nr:MoaD/ThiS family protein [Acidobacteriota bacterium]